MAADEPSICIPRVSPEVTTEQVSATFARVLGAESIERVDIVPWRGRGPDGPRRVFVHLRSWPTAKSAQAMRRRLLEGKEVHVVYADPWVWRCARSRVPKPARTGRAGILAPPLVAIARECSRG